MLLGALALFATSIGAQSTAPEDPKRVEALIKEIQAQQQVIADNQAKIDAKPVTLGEAIRVARIYASRGADKMRRYVAILGTVVLSLLLLPVSHGQTPAPIIIQAATPVPAVAPKPITAEEETKTQSTLQLLEQILATNAATIKKQEAALATLDELQKAAEEIKIFSKRG
ncbi:MAG: hypothetical protein H0W66_10325 [Chthoniobacterales bacterium]|nr:hypothetical protein [Chthoniobacterales bacterium]